MAIIRTRHHFRNLRIMEHPAWVPSWATVGFDFANNRAFGDEWRGRLTCVRSSTADYAANLAGVWLPFPANVPRITDRGMLVEKASTNVVIQNRDLSNAAWVKVNTTAAKDQVGIDGVTNSASSVTATAGNGTILQTDVLGSSSRLVSVFAKRITGTGTINLTGDGSTFTAITLTSTWTRFTLPAATVVNPVTGFQIVTSGDVIAVDFVQNETGPIATSPILTGATSVARSIDSVLMSPLLPSWFNPLEGTLLAEGIFSSISDTGNHALVSFDDGTVNNRITLREGNNSLGSFVVSVAAATQAGLTGGGLVIERINKVAGAYQTNNFQVAANGVIGTADVSGTIPTVTQLRFGDNNGTPLAGYLRKFFYGPRAISPNQFVRATMGTLSTTTDAP